MTQAGLHAAELLIREAGTFVFVVSLNRPGMSADNLALLAFWAATEDASLAAAHMGDTATPRRRRRSNDRLRQQSRLIRLATLGTKD